MKQEKIANLEIELRANWMQLLSIIRIELHETRDMNPKKRNSSDLHSKYIHNGKLFEIFQQYRIWSAASYYCFMVQRKNRHSFYFLVNSTAYYLHHWIYGWLFVWFSQRDFTSVIVSKKWKAFKLKVIWKLLRGGN